MKKIKTLGIVLSSALILSLFAGCTSNETSSKSDSSESKEAVTVEFFNQKPEIKDLMDELISDYNASQSEVIIKQNNVPDPGTVLQTRLSSGDVPEILTHWPNAAFKEQVEAGMYMDLTGDAAFDNVSEEVVEQSKIDGKNYCVPISFNTVGIYYNKDMFEQNNWTVPTTYDDLITLCKSIKATGVDPIGLANKMPGSVFQYASSLFYGMPDYDKFIEDTKECKIDLDAYGDQIEDVGNKILELNTYAPASSAGAEDSQVVADFANSKVAMFISGSWQIPQINAANKDLNFEMFTFPGKTEDKTIAGVFAGDFSLAMSNTAKYPDLDKKFLAYMATKDVAEKYAKTDGSASCIKGVDYVAPELEKQYEVIKSGKIAAYTNENWTVGSYYTDVGTTMQQLLVSKDSASWANSLKDIFNK